MFGAYYFGQSFFGESPAYTVGTSDSRDNCGGVFGTATFGQPYFGGHIQCGEPPPAVQPTRPDCGGMFGTATFGQPYFGGHYECNVFAPPGPVIPPVVVPVVPPGGGGVAGGRTRYVHERMPDLDEDRQRTREKWEKAQIEADDEEILLIISLWMGLK